MFLAEADFSTIPKVMVTSSYVDLATLDLGAVALSAVYKLHSH